MKEEEEEREERVVTLNQQDVNVNGDYRVVTACLTAVYSLSAEQT